MENLLLISLSRQTALRNKMDVIANNIANVNTTGFKRDSILFEEYISNNAQANQVGSRDKQVSYVHDVGIVRDYQNGALKSTGNPLDIALNDKGWFVVETADGERFTRNGELKLSNEGVLVSPEGHPVLGEGGQITFGPEENNIVIARDGTISSSAGVKGKIRVVQFEDLQQLKKEGLNLLKTDQAPQPVENPAIVQGMLEQSNVQPVLEMTKMIETVRAYTSLSRMMQSATQSRTKAIERLGTMPQ